METTRSICMGIGLGCTSSFSLSYCSLPLPLHLLSLSLLLPLPSSFPHPFPSFPLPLPFLSNASHTITTRTNARMDEPTNEHLADGRFTTRRMGTAAGRYQSQPLNNTNPLRRDTVLIPAYSWMVLRFVVDNRTSPLFLFPSLPPSRLLLFKISKIRQKRLTLTCGWCSGPMGLPLPPRLAYGRRPAHADQRAAVKGCAVGRAGGYCGSV